jgi:two-component system nitrate/nitrite response regulator NarL
VSLTVVASEPRHVRTAMPRATTPTAVRPLLLAEPNELARMGFHRMLERSSPGTPIHSVVSWWSATELINRNPPSVLFVSSELESEPDNALCAYLERADIHVVLLVRSSDRRRLRAFLRLPISAVMQEEDFSVTAFDQLLAGLADGAHAVHRNANRYLLALAADTGTAGQPPINLTPRETDTLRAVAQGLTNRQISRQMGISEHGVKRHLANVLAKLHASNRTMAVTTAIQRGLLPQPTAQGKAG